MGRGMGHVLGGMDHGSVRSHLVVREHLVGQQLETLEVDVLVVHDCCLDGRCIHIHIHIKE